MLSSGSILTGTIVSPGKKADSELWTYNHSDCCRYTSCYTAPPLGRRDLVPRKTKLSDYMVGCGTHSNLDGELFPSVVHPKLLHHVRLVPLAEIRYLHSSAKRVSSHHLRCQSHHVVAASQLHLVQAVAWPYRHHLGLVYGRV